MRRARVLQTAVALGTLGGLILVAIGMAALFATWLPGGGRLAVPRPRHRVPAGTHPQSDAEAMRFQPGSCRLSGHSSWSLKPVMRLAPSPAGCSSFASAWACWRATQSRRKPKLSGRSSPGLVLIGFGAFVEASTFGAPFANFWGLAQFWPLILVVIGAWLLLRERLPADVRTPVALVGTAILILLGLLVAASAVATAGIPYAGGPIPMPMPRPMVQVPFGTPLGTPPVQDTITLSAPVDSVSAIRLVNTSGTTLVRSTTAPQVTVLASRHYWNAAQPPDVRLVPTDGILTVESSATAPGNLGHLHRLRCRRARITGRGHPVGERQRDPEWIGRACPDRDHQRADRCLQPGRHDVYQQRLRRHSPGDITGDFRVSSPAAASTALASAESAVRIRQAVVRSAWRLYLRARRSQASAARLR